MRTKLHGLGAINVDSTSLDAVWSSVLHHRLQGLPGGYQDLHFDSVVGDEQLQGLEVADHAAEVVDELSRIQVLERGIGGVSKAVEGVATGRFGVFPTDVAHSNWVEEAGELATHCVKCSQGDEVVLLVVVRKWTSVYVDR
jgi:hypothetical protein